jgi:APA family basic amino acid/polyamine antiporter
MRKIYFFPKGKDAKKMLQDPGEKNAQPPAELGKEIKARHFFSLAFGCIIGVGWIIILGEWLEQAGPLGAMLAFAGGALLIMIIGLCYAEVASLLPAAGGAVVYAFEISGTKTSFAMGWFLALSFIATISFEAISAGWIVNTLLPGTEGEILYTVGGESVRLGSLLFGLGGMALLTFLSYKGIKSAAVFQEVLTYALILISIVFISAGIFWGKVSNLEPLFAKSGIGPVLGGITAVFIMIPFMLSGFEVIPQTVEEKAPGTSLKLVGKVILLSIGAACVFYLLCILSASMAIPWKKIVPMELPAAGAFEAAFRSSLMAKVVLFAGLFGIITTWNTCFIVATRIIFSLGRARIISPVFGKIHPVFRSPYSAVIFVGIAGSLGTLLGRSAIVPVANVAGATMALAYATTCFVLIKLRRVRPGQHRPYRVPGGTGTAVFGLLSALFMLFLALYFPFVSARGRIPMEWAIFFAWAILGMIFWFFARKVRQTVSEAERYRLILGKTGSPGKKTG